MLRVLSTHLFLNQRLHPGLLELAGRAGAQAVEVFAARQHFDYTRREDVRELGDWFRSNPLEPFSMHAPLFPDREMGRAVHLGEREDGWSQRTVEYALTALEHLGAFARPLGVQVLVENLVSEPTTPEHLVTILELGHLDNVGVCLDLGHAHMTVGIADAVSVLGKRIVTLHVHDNHGLKDEHLWPGDGSIDWVGAAKAIEGLGKPPAAVLEIAKTLGEATAELPDRVRAGFERLG